MKGILIDPHSRAVTEVEVAKDYRDIYRVIEADTFDARGLAEGVAMYVDDEGIFKEDQRFFHLGPWIVPGKALVLGVDQGGDSVDVPRACTVDLIAQNVKWIPEGVSFSHIETTEGEVETAFGRMTQITQTAVFVDGEGNEYARA